jgi:hypothetical protein
MTDKGDVSEYLGTIKLSQQHVIQQILNGLGFNE